MVDMFVCGLDGFSCGMVLQAVFTVPNGYRRDLEILRLSKPRSSRFTIQSAIVALDMKRCSRCAVPLRREYDSEAWCPKSEG